MIIESKEWQFSFFIFGILLICIGTGCLININDIYLNICLVKGSYFAFVLNKIITVLTMVLAVVMGILIIRLVINSIKKCSEFEGEKPKFFFNSKSFLHTIIFSVIVVGALASGVIAVNYFFRNLQVKRDISGRSTTLEKIEKNIHITGEIISFTPKDSETVSHDWDNYSGTALFCITAPEKYSGLYMHVKVKKSDKSEQLWKTQGSKCSFTIPEKVIKFKYYGSKKILCSSDDIILLP